MYNHLYHDSPANLVCESSTDIFLINVNLLGYKKNDNLIQLIIKLSLVHNNSNALGDQKTVINLHSIQHDLPIPLFLGIRIL